MSLQQVKPSADGRRRRALRGSSASRLPPVAPLQSEAAHPSSPQRRLYTRFASVYFAWAGGFRTEQRLNETRSWWLCALAEGLRREKPVLRLKQRDGKKIVVMRDAATAEQRADHTRNGGRAVRMIPACFFKSSVS